MHSRTVITLITAITVMMVIAWLTFFESPAKGVTSLWTIADLAALV